MSQPNQKKVVSDNQSIKIRVVPQGTLEKMFEQHGNQFLKWNFLPFLHHKERSSLRASCTLLKNFIPAPHFLYTKTKDGNVSLQATARLERLTGYVETRGHGVYGGDSSTVAHELQSNVIKICSTYYAFAALKKTGKVITWGLGSLGGDCSSVFSELQYGVTQICGNDFAFAALKQEGKVVTWGDSNWGGNSSAVSMKLQSGVTNIVGARGAFAALKSDGKVISWGSRHYGGDSSHLSSLNNGVIKLEAFSNIDKFQATKSDGSIIQWP